MLTTQAPLHLFAPLFLALCSPCGTCRDKSFIAYRPVAAFTRLVSRRIKSTWGRDRRPLPLPCSDHSKPVVESLGPQGDRQTSAVLPFILMLLFTLASIRCCFCLGLCTDFTLRACLCRLRHFAHPHPHPFFSLPPPLFLPRPLPHPHPGHPLLDFKQTFDPGDHSMFLKKLLLCVKDSSSLKVFFSLLTRQLETGHEKLFA